MTVHETHTGKLRTIGRFVWHYIEMVIAMILGMLLLGMVWGAVLPEITRTDVNVLIMAADMTIGMAVWMGIRRHSRGAIAEMSLAMILPFVILLVPYWFGVLPGPLVTSIGHVLMFVLMAVAMLRRRDEYVHHHRFVIRWKWVRTAAIVLVALLIPAGVSAVNTIGKFGDMYRPRTDAVVARPVAKAHDAAKPTVAFLVGGKGANVADLLGPYEVLASTGRFNTYVVSAGPRLVPLTGGLDIVPDLTFEELGRLLGERHDALDAVVIPALQPPEPAEFEAVNAWLRRQSAAGALTVSVCTGARALAASGLLDGRAATSHWLRLSGLRKDFTKVNWESGRRYVDDGNVISTAGVLSGIDGALRIVERLTDVDTARRAARAVHWRHYSPGAAAPIPTAALEPSDAVAVLNASYQTGPSTIGVHLTDGVDELELASIFVTYTEESVIGRTIALGDGPIRSKYGLTFVPRSTVAAAADDLDRLLVPGPDTGRRDTAGAVGPRPEHLHTTGEFAFDPVLRDIAHTYDVQTARFAAKTLEYPRIDLKLAGSAWPWPSTIVPLLLALLGAAVAVATGVVVRRLRTPARRPQPLDEPTATGPADAGS
jgi:putative intracellular protease/amidase